MTKPLHGTVAEPVIRERRTVDSTVLSPGRDVGVRLCRTAQRVSVERAVLVQLLRVTKRDRLPSAQSLRQHQTTYPGNILPEIDDEHPRLGHCYLDRRVVPDVADRRDHHRRQYTARPLDDIRLRASDTTVRRVPFRIRQPRVIRLPVVDRRGGDRPTADLPAIVRRNRFHRAVRVPEHKKRP